MSIKPKNRVLEISPGAAMTREPYQAKSVRGTGYIIIGYVIRDVGGQYIARSNSPRNAWFAALRKLTQ